MSDNEAAIGFFMDLIGDAGAYMAAAAKAVGKPCEQCSGTGATKLGEHGSAQFARQLLGAFAQDVGGTSTIAQPGDDCIYCNGTGQHVDDTALLKEAAREIVADYPVEAKAIQEATR